MPLSPPSAATLAAILYDDGVAVDALMATFAHDLARDGFVVRGMLQVPPVGSGCGPRQPLQLLDLGTGALVPICQDLGPNATSCTLDSQALAMAAARLREAALGPADLVMVSRFGKQEAQGHGFRDEIALAVCEGRPVLTAVKRGMINRWLDFTGGIGTLLDHRLWVLHHWWRDCRTGLGVAA